MSSSTSKVSDQSGIVAPINTSIKHLTLTFKDKHLEKRYIKNRHFKRFFKYSFFVSLIGIVFKIVDLVFSITNFSQVNYETQIVKICLDSFSIVLNILCGIFSLSYYVEKYFNFRKKKIRKFNSILEITVIIPMVLTILESFVPYNYHISQINFRTSYFICYLYVCFSLSRPLFKFSLWIFLGLQIFIGCELCGYLIYQNPGWIKLFFYRLILSFFGLLVNIYLIYVLEKRERLLFYYEVHYRKQKLKLTDQKKKCDKLVVNILPSQFLEKIEWNKSLKLAQKFDNLIILLSDFVDFTHFCEKKNPQVIVNVLNVHYSKFDYLCKNYEIERITTIGDAYLCADFNVDNESNNYKRMCKLAIDMLRTVKIIDRLKMRIGIASGPCSAVVLGKIRITFDLIGCARIEAEHLEQFSKNNRILVNEQIYYKVKNDFKFDENYIKYSDPILGRKVAYFLAPLLEERIRNVENEKNKLIRDNSFLFREEKKNFKNGPEFQYKEVIKPKRESVFDKQPTLKLNSSKLSVNSSCYSSELRNSSSTKTDDYKLSSIGSKISYSSQYSFKKEKKKKKKRRKRRNYLKKIEQVLLLFPNKFQYKYLFSLSDEIGSYFFFLSFFGIIFQISCFGIHLIFNGVTCFIPEKLVYWIIILCVFIIQIILNILIFILRRIKRFNISFVSTAIISWILILCNISIPILLGFINTETLTQIIINLVYWNIFLVVFETLLNPWIKMIVLFISSISIISVPFLILKIDLYGFIYCATLSLFSIIVYFVVMTGKQLNEMKSFAKYHQTQSKITKTQNEKERAEMLILSVLPYQIYEQLQDGFSNISTYVNGTICFAKIEGFYSLFVAEKEAIFFLADVFSEFDKLVEKFKCKKIKSIGNTFICIAGFGQPQKLKIGDDDNKVSHTEIMLRLVNEFIKLVKKKKKEHGEVFNALGCKIGLSSGPFITGLIGTEDYKFHWDVFGQIINISARMCMLGEKDRIHVHESTKKILENNYNVDIMKRENVEVKGIGICDTYYIKYCKYVK